MYDLDLETLPNFEVKFGGRVYKFDLIETAYKLEGIDNLGDDPARVRSKIENVFEFKGITTFQAHVLLRQFREFCLTAEVDEHLKKVFGRGLFSPTTSGSPVKTVPISPQESSADISPVSQ